MELVPIEPAPPPPAANFSDAEVQAMQRAVIRLFDNWGITDAQAACLLGDMPIRTYQRWKQGVFGRWNVYLAARLSNLIGIHMALRLLYTERKRGYRWIKAPNPCLWRTFGARGHARWPAYRSDARPALSRQLSRRLVIFYARCTAGSSWLTVGSPADRNKYPPIDLFEDLAHPEDWALLAAAEARANPRVGETIGNSEEFIGRTLVRINPIDRGCGWRQRRGLRPGSCKNHFRNGVEKAGKSLKCGCSSMVEQKLPKLTTRVRFPSPAPISPH